MENKDTDGVSPVGGDGLKQPLPPPSDPLHQPPDLNALSLDPDSQPFISQERPLTGLQRLLRFVRRLDVLLVVLLLIAGGGILFAALNRKEDNKQSASVADRFQSVQIPLNDIIGNKDLSLNGASNVTINGIMQLNNGLVIGPSLQPNGAKAGQIYYDQTNNQLAYFNGTNFVFLNDTAPGGVQSLGGATGQLTLGSGVTLVNNELRNSGVLSVQGQTGAVTFTAGAGIIINGTTFSNDGVLSVSSSSPEITVQNDGAGNITLSLNALPGTGTVSSSGGTNGTIPVFTAAQNVEDSIITQSGLNITIGGGLNVTGALTLGSALSVANGGTGATTLTNNGVLVGQGAGAITSVAAGGAGLCLLSTAGAPAWGVCPGGGSAVTSLNGLTGALNIANASGVGSTITIDDATTSSKGIASFNSTNFTVTSGAVNTIQNINTTASPTFSGVNTNNITPSGTLTVGVTGQTLILQGNASTQLTANNGANSTTISFQSPTGNATYRFLTASGTFDICTSAGNCTGIGGGVTTPGGTTNRLSKFTGAQTIGDSTITDSGTNVQTSVDLVVQGGDITIGVPTSQSGTINLAHSGSAFLGSIVQGAISANRTYTLPDANGTFCLSSGNCAASGVTSLNGLTGALSIANASGAGSTITIDDASTSNKGIASFNSTNFSVTSGAVNTTQDINTTATPTFSGVNTNNITPSSTLTVGATGQTLILQGNASTQLVASNGANSTTVSFQSPTGNATYRFLTASGTFDVCTTAGNCVGVGGAVTTSGGTTNRLSKFTGAQAIGDSTITDNGTNVLTSVDLVVQGGDVTVGVPTSQSGTINLAHSGSAFLGSIVQGALSANRTYTLPDANGTFCLSSGNCAASGVTSLNGLVGALNIANASGVGSTITIDDATTSSKGIASFNSTNFTVTSGAVNTIQNINTTASPTFTAINTNTINPSGALTVGATGQTALFRGSITTISSNGAGNDIILSSADTIELQGTTNVTGNADISGTLAVGTGNAFQVAASGDISTSGIAVISGASVAIGGSSQSGSLILNDGSSNTGTLSVAPLGQDTVYTLPDPGVGSVSICLTSGNCAGTGGGVTTPGGTTNRLAKFTGAQAIGDSTISDNGTNVTTTVDLIIQGGDVTVGVANSQTGIINLAHSGSAFLGSILQGALTANRSYTLPDASGTICLTSGNCSGSGSSSTLQAAYDAGNTITTTNARDLAFTLADTVTDANFTIDVATGATGSVAIRRADGAGTNDPSQLLLLDNLDTDRLQPTGLRIQSAAGGMTTAIDVSDPEIVTALSTGANDISGTNYSIAGATGNIITAGDIVVNGGDITSSGALNITPGGTLTIGVAGQQIILQGNASTQLIANGGGFSTTLGFTGTPVGNVVYNFDRSVAAGTYTICTSAAACPGSQTPLNFNNGLTNTSGTVQLGGSLIQNTTIATGINGLSFTSDLTSADRFTPIVSITQANGANVSLAPLLSVTNSDTNSNLDLVTFTHNPSSAGVVLSLNGSSSTGLLVNTGGGGATRGINVTTSVSSGIGIRVDASTVTSGQGISIEGNELNVLPAFTGAMLQVAPTKQLIGGSGTLTDTGNYLKVARSNIVNSAGRTWANTGDLAVFSSNCTQTAGTCTDSGRILSLNQQYSNATGAVLSVQNAGSGNLLELRNASTLLARFASNGNLTLGSTSTAGDIFLTDGTGNAFTNNLGTTTLTASRNIDLPDASGTVCLQSSSACGFLTGSATDYIQNQSSVSQTANWRITGTGRADTALQAPLFDTASAGALAIGTTNATSISLQQNTTIASGKSLTLQGAFTMTPSADTTSIFNIRTSGSNNMFTVDTQNSQIGIALGGINLPSLTSSGVQIRGAIRLSGASSTFADTYITTKVAGGGSPVPALISAVNYDPGSGGQVIAAGVPVGSDGNARAISGFDARTSAHQPTIAVLSPGETQIAGFSWDGSDTTFLTKTSSANMVLQANSLNILTLQNVSSAARLGIGNGSPAYALDVTGDANLSSGSAYKINGTDICTGSGCTPVTTCNVSGNYICNGGNTPVSSVAIGTTNAQPLNFMTNGSTRGSFSSAGIFQVNGNGTGTARIGGDCSSNYTAINLGGTTPFDCTSYNFLSGPTDTSLYINRPSGSSIFMREGNSSTNHLSIAGGGAFTAQNTTDTTAGFRVLNAGSVPLFQIDTSLTRVYIGNPTGDTTGALLVLDTKTDASDPTGVDGGMYFNSFYKRLRCYYDGQWRFCNDPVGLTYGFNLEEDFVGGGPNVGSHNWTTSLGSGGAASVIQGAAAIPDLAARPGQVRLSLGTVSTGVQYASIWLNGNSTEPVILGNTNGTRIEVEFAANMPNLADATNDFNVHMGLCNNSPDNGCNDGIYFEYDRDQSVNWRYGAANNSSRTLTNSSTAVTTGWHRFKMVFTYSSSGPTATIDYYVDGTLIGTHTNTNVPTTRSTQPQFDIMRDSGAGTTDRQLIVDYFQYRSSFTSAR